MTGRTIRYAVVASLVCAGILIALMSGLFKDSGRPGASVEGVILASFRAGEERDRLQITYPFEGAVFPPDIIAPTFRWKDEQTDADIWLVCIEFKDEEGSLTFLVRQKQWTPSDKQWETIKARSLEREARVSVAGVNQVLPKKILSAASITISTSKDEVGAPIFYREVNLPFIDAVKDPSRIRWRFGEICSKTQPPIVLEKLPVCGNCHSFSVDGKLLGMDVDYANDKGSYVIAPAAERIILDRSKIITWDDYKKEDKEKTLGLLSQVSPDGKYVISTVKDLSVFVPQPDLEFSQLFFPVKGILVYYRRATGTFHALPGADDKKFVQSNPVWSPDGTTLIFARSKVHHMKTGGNKVLLSEEECREFLHEGKTFLFDLYRIPFNDGKGGQARPLRGASNNGMSNYFPKYSPDGKWIVFCKAKSFMLLQPDSELYIVPAEGGRARRMRCNTSRMNSWHSWSPSGRWLVFSSKAKGPYTQLWLTHVDRQGRSTPSVLLSHFTAPDRAANIPEFVNVSSGAIKRISQQFVDEHSFLRAARQNVVAGDLDGAVRFCRKALKFNPESAETHDYLGIVLLRKGMPEEAKTHFARAIQCQPDYAFAHVNLGFVLRRQGRLDKAIEHLKKAVEIDPNLAGAHNSLGAALHQRGELHEAIKHYGKAVEIDPRHGLAHDNWGNALSALGEFSGAIEHYERAVEIDPENFFSRHKLAALLNQQGEVEQAITQYQKAIEINSNSLTAINDLAWLLATCPKDGICDGARAVELAERACRATDYEIPALMDTLAAAYARAGRFSEAIDTAQKALELAQPKQELLAERIRRRLEHYKGGKAYRQQP